MTYIWQKQETWIHWIFPTWEKFVITNGGKNNNNNTNKDYHKMTQKPFMIFTHFDLNSSSFRTDSKQIVSSRSIYTYCTGVLTHLKNRDSLQTVSSFRLFIIYFDSQQCDFLYSSSRAHFLHEARYPMIETQPHGRCIGLPWVSSWNVTGMSGCWCFFLVYVCLLCFGKAGGDGHKRLGIAILNSESACLATDFQAIK